MSRSRGWQKTGTPSAGRGAAVVGIGVAEDDPRERRRAGRTTARSAGAHRLDPGVEHGHPVAVADEVDVHRLRAGSRRAPPRRRRPPARARDAVQRAPSLGAQVGQAGQPRLGGRAGGGQQPELTGEVAAVDIGVVVDDELVLDA